MTPDQVPAAHVDAFRRAWNDHTGTPAPEDAIRVALAATLPQVEGNAMLNLARLVRSRTAALKRPKLYKIFPFLAWHGEDVKAAYEDAASLLEQVAAILKRR